MASGAVGSPGRSLILGSEDARDCARLEVGSRVRARILMGAAVLERRAFTTELPWVPVEPTTRKV